MCQNRRQSREGRNLTNLNIFWVSKAPPDALGNFDTSREVCAIEVAVEIAICSACCHCSSLRGKDEADGERYIIILYITTTATWVLVTGTCGLRLPCVQVTALHLPTTRLTYTSATLTLLVGASTYLYAYF